jgi:hypothetical protein
MTVFIHNNLVDSNSPNCIDIHSIQVFHLTSYFRFRCDAVLSLLRCSTFDVILFLFSEPVPSICVHQIVNSIADGFSKRSDTN